MLENFLTSPISLIGFNLVLIFPISLYPFNCLASGSVFSQLAISASKLYICAPVCNAEKGFEIDSQNHLRTITLEKFWCTMIFY